MRKSKSKSGVTRRASEALLDQRFFTLDPPESEAFTEALSNPPHANNALRKLMRSKAPWASGAGEK